MGRRIITDDQLGQLVELRERGFSHRQIIEWFAARGIAVSSGLVQWHCLRLGAEKPGPPPAPYVIRARVRGGHVVRPFTPEEDAVLLELAVTEPNRAEIARRLGRARNTVVTRLMTLARRDARGEAGSGPHE